jgi:methionine sulfoxide reductase heme-binding subunit
MTAFADNPLWYVARSAGLTSFVLLTATTVLGMVATRRVASVSWPRFATQRLHRNLSLLAVVFLVAHIGSVLLDSYVHTVWWAAVVPFTASYHPVYVGLGAIVLDLLIVIIGTSLVRARIGQRTWRAIHWLAYALWPLAVVHYLGAGTDAGAGWGLALAVLAIVVVGSALVARLVAERSGRRLVGGRA